MQALPDLTPEQAEALARAKIYMDQHRREFTLEEDWYPWQHQIFETTKPQVMCLAGNRSGKTRTAAHHVACDLTGHYPDWWRGYRFEHAPNVMVAGVDNTQLKDVVQQELFGDVVEDPVTKRKRFTGSWVHVDEIGRITWSKQTTDLATTVEVFNRYGRAHCRLRAYTQSKQGQGTLSFAGYSLDRVWIDECPPDELVGQLVIRLMTGNYNRGGHILYTMTPELGATGLVTQFMENRQSSQELIGPISWSQCPHLTPDVQASILQGVPPHEHDMRRDGAPFFGSGLVYPVPEDRIKIAPFSIEEAPAWMKFLRAIDLGIDHPTAITWLGYDPEIDCIYLMRDYSKSGESAAYHMRVADTYMPWAPIVFPPDVDTTEKGSGKTVRAYYEEAGLRNALDFKNPDGSNKVEPGIMEIDDRMRTERFKAFPTCENFFREKRLYHRKDGKLVKKNDDVMSALRYGAMMIPEHGVPLGGYRRSGRKPTVKSSFGHGGKRHG